MRITSFKLPEAIHTQVKERVIQDGLGMRGKNVWIKNAIEAFLMLQDYLLYVELADDMEGLNSTVSVRLPDSVLDNMEKTVTEVRLAFPRMEGVKSRIIRASIMQYLLR